MKPWSVGRLTSYLKSHIEGDPRLANVLVEGEVSNCSQARSGHWYWTLKDEGSQIDCVMFRSAAARQAHRPTDGALILVQGAVGLYKERGRVQIVVVAVEPAGRGALHAEFERLRARLEAEGLFDAGLKRPLPRCPLRIGVVTSRDAAALQDIKNVLARRWPIAHLILAHTPVQGDEAPGGIVAALEAIAGAGVDTVIVARGGGSLEDLWAFNDEGVARAIRSCPRPVVTGVGHETDVTIADLAADVRASTPSAAAEVATPNRQELLQSVDALQRRAGRAAERYVESVSRRVTLARRRLTAASPVARLGRRLERLEERRRRLLVATAGRVRELRSDVAGLRRRVTDLGPQATFERGYAHVRRQEDGRTVMSPAQAPPGTSLSVQVARGRFAAVAGGAGPPDEDTEEGI